MKTYLKLFPLVAFLCFTGAPLQAQYVFDRLGLLGSTIGGGIFISGNNVVLTYLDPHGNPTSFLYQNDSYKLIDDILVGTKTAAAGIDGSNIIGGVEDDQRVGHGFLYSNGVYTTLTYPGAVQTSVSGISGSNIVGTYQDTSNIEHGFLYSAGTYKSISLLGALRTTTTSVSGSTVVGTYEDTSHLKHGFIYSAGAYTPINFPTSSQTFLGQISGSNILGTYCASGDTTKHAGVKHSFLYNAGSYTPLDYPSALATIATGISGTTIVGSCLDTSEVPHGFVYDTGTQDYTMMDVPGSRQTSIVGISGTTIVGAYEDLDFVYRGFIASPATKTLTLGGNLTFGSVTVNTTATGTLTITNSGNTTVTVTGVSCPTGFSGSFTGPIAPANTANVVVSFTPTAVTTYGGNISVASNATGSPNTEAVSGSGVNVSGNAVKSTVSTVKKKSGPSAALLDMLPAWYLEELKAKSTPKH